MHTTHPIYDRNKSKWQMALDHYSGKYATDKKQIYLHQKSQREPDEGFEERLLVTEPMTHFSTAVDGLCGIMFSKDEETVREWGMFGDPENENDVAFRLKQDADGIGTNWESVFKKAAINLTVTHNIWGIVDGLNEKVYNEGTQDEIRELTGDATIHVIDPTSVVNWFPTNGPLEEVIVKEDFDDRTSVEDAFGIEDVYVKYTLDGWERFKVTIREDEPQRENIDSGQYTFYDSAEQNERILPIFRVEIPMPRPVGYLLAEKENAIWNLESARDFAIRSISFSLLRLTLGNEDEYKLIKEALKKGSSIIPQYAKEGNPHDFISPDASWLGEAANVLEKKVEDFYQSAFKEYGDAAQRTATEIRLESQTGIEAFLALLVDSVDEFENQCFKRLEQIYFPNNPSVWGQANVERSREFAPEDTNEVLQQLSSSVMNAQRANAMSLETKVRTLHPDQTDDWIEEEVTRIREEQGAIPIPQNQQNEGMPTNGEPSNSE